MQGKRFRVFATSDIGQAINILRERGYDVEVYSSPDAPPKDLLLEKVRSGVDGLITTLRDQIDEEVFKAGRGTLKGVAQYAVGFDNVDRTAANRYKIPFTNTPDVLTDTTAEFAFSIMLDVSRKLWSSERLVRERRWGSWHAYLPFLGDEVTGKVLAVIGTGRIGQAMIRKCLGFDMNVLCFDAAYENEGFVHSVQAVMDAKYQQRLCPKQNWIKYESLETCLRQADYVSLHVPLLREGEASTPTYHLINERTLQMMKPTAYLVNTSRGPVIDEDALYKALKEHWISGAALDVFEQEPLPDNSPLRDPEIEDRIRLFHHFASGGTATRLSPDANVGMAGRCVDCLIALLEKGGAGKFEEVPHLVNKEAFQ